MNMKTRLTAFLLSLFLLIGLFPAAALAVENDSVTVYFYCENPYTVNQSAAAAPWIFSYDRNLIIPMQKVTISPADVTQINSEIQSNIGYTVADTNVLPVHVFIKALKSMNLDPWTYVTWASDETGLYTTAINGNSTSVMGSQSTTGTAKYFGMTDLLCSVGTVIPQSGDATPLNTVGKYLTLSALTVSEGQVVRLIKNVRAYPTSPQTSAANMTRSTNHPVIFQLSTNEIALQSMHEDDKITLTATPYGSSGVVTDKALGAARVYGINNGTAELLTNSGLFTFSYSAQDGVTGGIAITVKAESEITSGTYLLAFDPAYTDGSLISYACDYVLLTFGGGGGTSSDKTALQAQIARVTGERAADWYQSDDRYNGTITSANGFWADMTAAATGALTVAEAVNLNITATESEIAAAAAALEAAVGKLIPRTEVNATALYEAVKSAKETYTESSQYTSSRNYTVASWAVYQTALSAAGGMLDSLYNEDGFASDINWGPDRSGEKPGGAVGQADADDAVTSLGGAISSLCTLELLEKAVVYRNAISSLNNIIGELQSNDYEENSRTTFENARGAALAFYQEGALTSANTGKARANEAIALYKAFAEAYYEGLKSASDSISVSLRVTDNLGAKYPAYALTDAATAVFDDTVTLAGGAHTFAGLKAAAGLDFSANMTGAGALYVAEQYYVFLNGVLVCDPWSGDGVITPTDINNDGVVDAGDLPGDSIADSGLIVRDGDEVVLARAERPNMTYYGANPGNAASYASYKEYIALLRLAGAAAAPIEVREGESFTLTVEKTSGLLTTYNGQYRPAANVSLLMSAPAAGPGEVTAAATDSGAVTGGDGKASLAIYEAGWYTVGAADIRDQTPSSGTADGETGGVYPNLAAGDFILVHVTGLGAEELSAAKVEYLKQLDELFSGYSEEVFGASLWAQAQIAYTTAKEAVNSAASLAGAQKALADATAALEAYKAQADAANAKALEDFTWYLDRLPAAAEIGQGLFTKGDAGFYLKAQSIYEGMSVYQKNSVTGAQLARYEALAEAYGEDGSSLPEARVYTTTVKVTEGYGAYAAAAVYRYRYSVTDGALEKTEFNDAKTAVGEGLVIESPPAGGYTITVYECADINYEIYDIKWEGADLTLNQSDYLPVGQYCWLSLNNTPRCDIIVTIYVRPSGEKTLDELKAAAKQELAGIYGAYVKADYTAGGWLELTGIYNAGVSAIDAAADSAGVDSAKAAAIMAMAAVEKRKTDPDPSTGTLGSVYVTIENSTYPGGAFTGTFINETIALNEDTTMMSAVLNALERGGYDWTGTGGKKDPKAFDDWDITYLSGVFRDGRSLSEFDGGPQSGWMGTLNDWFVNEGFASFTASAANNNYRIVDGDHIAIKYTAAGYGTDLGGGWKNADTSLKSLSAGGGTMKPGFNSGTLTYVLNIGSGSTASVTPAAANKNYQVRTYLNEKNGDNWYRIGESIPVKSGDIIYVGVGDVSWPSMNKQGSDAIPYTGTWYTVYVVNSSSSSRAMSLISLISAITYANYQAQGENAALARTVYDMLSGEAKAKVTNYTRLTAAESKIEEYQEIDSVKALLAAIPKSSTITKSNMKTIAAQVLAAKAAYDKLSDEQKLYITVGIVANYNAAIKVLTELGAFTADNAPSPITGSDKEPEEPGGTIILNPAVTAANGMATVSISAADLTNAIAEAKENGSAAIVIAPEITGTAKKVTVELPKASLSSIAAETDADIVVETPVGSLRIPNDVLSGISAQASGGTVTMSLAAVDTSSLTAEQKKAAGENPVYDISIMSGGKNISSFSGGSITISLPYTLKDGEDPSGVTVWYMDGSGKLQKMTAAYDEATGLAAFTTAHLSYYLVGYTAAWTNPFGDVKSTDWFYSAVKYVSRNNLMSGTSAAAFEPNANMTRAMLVTVLYRLEGKPDLTGTNSFTDVLIGQWYTDAVIWASTNKIVGGYGGGLFGTNDSVTREQLATILMNYAAYKKYDVTKTAALTAYTDASAVDSWAVGAMQWAVAEGLLTGRTAATLAPDGNATRAEVAVILMRFIENIAE